MKKNNIYLYLNLVSVLLMSCSILAQVGINTTDPKGILDFNSATYGVVYPNVALQATDDPDPVVNPQGGPIVEGTVVYNTNTTNMGTTTDVYPGIYVWNGSEWVVHYKKRQSELHNQTTVLRTEADFPGDWQDVPGLGISESKTFTAKYSGLYRIEIKTNFAGGQTDTNNEIFVSQATGQFRFLFDAAPYTFETTAFSAYTSYINGGTHYEGIWKESYKTVYLNLVAGTTYPFSLSFDAYDAPGFVGNGSTAPAGTDPTWVDLVNEDFESGYVVTQNHTPDPDCPTDGWIVSNPGADPCASCSGYTMNIAAGNNSSCQQNATALVSFTPTINSVDISFDYNFEKVNGPQFSSLRAYIYDETNGVQLGGDLFYFDSSVDSSYTGTIAVVAGTNYTLRFEYINTGRGKNAAVDNLIISEYSGPPTPPSTLGHGYVGNEINCQIEFTYIGE